MKVFVPCEPFDEVAYDINVDKSGIRHVTGLDIRIDVRKQKMELPMGVERATQFRIGSEWVRVVFEHAGEVTYGEANGQKAQGHPNEVLRTSRTSLPDRG